jgi:hypothetical protein
MTEAVEVSGIEYMQSRCCWVRYMHWLATDIVLRDIIVELVEELEIALSLSR